MKNVTRLQIRPRTHPPLPTGPYKSEVEDINNLVCKLYGDLETTIEDNRLIQPLDDRHKLISKQSLAAAHTEVVLDRIRRILLDAEPTADDVI